MHHCRFTWQRLAAVAAALLLGLFSTMPAVAGIDYGDRRIITSTADGVRMVDVADLDGDGKQDVLAAVANENTIRWYRNAGEGLIFEVYKPVVTGVPNIHLLRVADLDGDGDNDIIAAGDDMGNLAFIQNNGVTDPQNTAAVDVSFVYMEQIGTGLMVAPVRVSSRALDVADMDADGDLDIILALQGVDVVGWNVAWFENTGNTDDPENLISRTPHVITDSAPGACSVQAVDCNGDGRMDVLVASVEDDTVAWYMQEEDGTWTQSVVYNDNSAPDYKFTLDVIRMARAADLDNDGDLDVAVVCEGEYNGLVWFRYDAESGVHVMQIIERHYASRCVELQDMDGDGDTDILSTRSDRRIVLNDNLGDGTFAGSCDHLGDCPGPDATIIAYDVIPPATVITANLDGNSAPDVVWATYLDDTIAWHSAYRDPDTPGDGTDTDQDLGDSDVDSSGGCVMHPDAGLDASWLCLAVAAIGFMFRRRNTC